jgi:flavin-dependent dehydrogenase
MSSADTSTDTYDVIVVGARCAGSSTARLLAEAGHRVLLVDRASFPSDTVSTHCIDPVGIKLLETWGLIDKVLATNAPAVSRLVLNVGGGEFPNEQPDVYVTAPRRTVLDKLLVDEAVAAGVTLREGVTVKSLLRSSDGGGDGGDGAVVGVAGVDASGEAFTASAALVVGADGAHSFVASEVGAEQYDVRETQGTGYYAYYSGTPLSSVELGFAPNRFAGVFPTNDGEVCVFAGRTLDEFGDMRSAPDEAMVSTLRDISARLADATAAGTRTSRFFKYDAQPGFFRQAWGDGWALVGDAGFHIDPVTGRGIGHAFRDASLLAGAVDAGLRGAMPMTGALTSYQATRDRMSARMYDITQTIAALEWNDAELLQLFLDLVVETGALAEEVATWPAAQPPSPPAPQVDSSVTAAGAVATS